MRITFLCSCLEPGRDGVGDYTRRLCGELIRQEHQVTIVSLYDSYITEEFFGKQEIELYSLTVLRLPISLSTERRFERIKMWIDEFNPECLSLQFVPFGFQKKGLPFTLSRSLAPLGKGRRWHIMFHELWVGMTVESPIKLLLWGWLQRLIVQSLLFRLHPDFVHTHSHLYLAQLIKLGAKVHLLPLFSNIPLLNKNSVNKRSRNQIKLVLFGSIHPNAPVEAFSREAALFVKKRSIPLSLIVIGHTGVEQNRWALTWKSADLPVELLGEQSPEHISAILQDASFGLTTTPFALIEKSSAVAVMKEHGLPIICIAEQWHLRGNNKPLDSIPGIVEYHNGELENFLTKTPISPPTYSLSEVAYQFIDTLSK